MDRPEPPLPHKAKGINLGSCCVDFRDDKIMLFPIGADHHFTLSFGVASGEMDVHRTWHDKAHQPKHECLGALKHIAIPSLIQELGWLGEESSKLFRRLKPTWIRGNRLIIAIGLNPVTLSEMAKATQNRKGRLVGDPKKYGASVVVFDDPDYLGAYPDGHFTLCQRDGKQIGVGFKMTGPEGGKRLSWIRLRDLRGLVAKAEKPFWEILARHITPSTYRDE